jgi:uncharacterized protein YegP (UPF0339 family)
MHHIVKTKSGKFQVVLVAKNGEPLSISETLNSKQAAFKNIAAQVSVTGNILFYAQDDTTKTPFVYKVYQDGGRNQTEDLPSQSKYIPGKNPKKITPKKKPKP